MARPANSDVCIYCVFGSSDSNRQFLKRKNKLLANKSGWTDRLMHKVAATGAPGTFFWEQASLDRQVQLEDRIRPGTIAWIQLRPTGLINAFNIVEFQYRWPLTTLSNHNSTTSIVSPYIKPHCFRDILTTRPRMRQLKENSYCKNLSSLIYRASCSSSK